MIRLLLLLRASEALLIAAIRAPSMHLFARQHKVMTMVMTSAIPVKIFAEPWEDGVLLQAKCDQRTIGQCGLDVLELSADGLHGE